MQHRILQAKFFILELQLWCSCRVAGRSLLLSIPETASTFSLLSVGVERIPCAREALLDRFRPNGVARGAPTVFHHGVLASVMAFRQRPWYDHSWALVPSGRRSGFSLTRAPPALHSLASPVPVPCGVWFS